jgi:hypothetical protein
VTPFARPPGGGRGDGGTGHGDQFSGLKRVKSVNADGTVNFVLERDDSRLKGVVFD